MELQEHLLWMGLHYRDVCGAVQFVDYSELTRTQRRET